MTEQSISTRTRRKPFTAVLLSLIMPGLGQVYCGRLARGLVLNFLNILPLPIIIALFSLTNAPALVQITIVLILAAGIVQLVALIDSVCIARRTQPNYQLKDYNKWYVYLLLVFIVAGGSIGSSLYLRDRTLEAFIVPTASSYPTIVPGDRLLANKHAYNSADPKRGDLIVFLNPHDRNINFIKRVIAIAGDTIEIKASRVYINDKELPRQPIPPSELANIKIEVEGKPLEGDAFYETNGPARYKVFAAEPPHNTTPTAFPKTTIPKYHCFVLGDNRNHSFDSRAFGPVPLTTIIGRADHLYFPAQDWSRFATLKTR